jgi:hypothetical protein
MTQRYMAEVRLRVQAGEDISWIGESLGAAVRRLDRVSPSCRILSAVYVIDDGRICCVVNAASRKDVHRLLEIALLPAARVYEVVDVLAGTHLVRHPARDLDPGVDPEVVENVRHVGLDSPLR